LLGKIQDQGQFAGNFMNYKQDNESDLLFCLSHLGSSETTREAFVFKDNFFKFWFAGFVEGDGSFIVNKDGYLEFKVTQSSVDAQILFYIKKALGFGVVRVQDKFSNTHCFRVRNKQGLFNIISILNGNLFLDTRKEQFKL